MTGKIEISFQEIWRELPISKLVPSRLVSAVSKTSTKYRQIADSINEVGVVEPLVVFRVSGRKEEYLVLDGHMRLEVLKDKGDERAPCIISKDDEAYTYNKRINRIGTVQEHHMILRAIENGVPEDRIAAALGIKVSSVKRKKALLDGICEEVTKILENVRFSDVTAKILKRMKPIRQIEVAELMVATNNYSASYAKALLIATPKPQMADPNEKKAVRGVSEEQYSKMEQEMKTIRRDLKAVEDDYGVNMLRLVVANGFVGRLFDNSRVSKFIERRQPAIFEQLITLQDSVDSDIGTGAKH